MLVDYIASAIEAGVTNWQFVLRNESLEFIAFPEQHVVLVVSLTSVKSVQHPCSDLVTIETSPRNSTTP